MKEMEAKTENRYEYRKLQEKRKHMIAPDLFEFAYVPDWYGHLAELERLALPESWKFRKPSRETKNADTPILERYIHTIFRKQVIDFNSESDPRKADSIFHLENECVCFHTGLYTRQYKGIYGYFERNNFSDSLRDWYFRGFCDEEEEFFVGDGAGKPVGIFNATGGGEVGVTTTTANITFDDVMDLFYSLKAPYRKKAKWILNDSTVKALRKLKDSNGNYIWQPSVSVGVPDMILNRPYYTSTFAPEVAAGATPLAFGDFSYYWIADREGRSFKRLNELYATTGQVGFLASQRVDGKLILPEAVKLLSMKSA